MAPQQPTLVMTMVQTMRAHRTSECGENINTNWIVCREDIARLSLLKVTNPEEFKNEKERHLLHNES
jgi:hypothetical protein